MLGSVSGKGLLIHELTSLEELRPVSGAEVAGTRSFTWNHTNQVVAVGGASDTITLLQANNGQLLSTIPFHDEEAFEGVVKSIAFSSNSRYLASSAHNNIHLWDLKRRHLKATFSGHKGSIICLSVSSESGIISGDALGVIRVWDIKSGVSSREMVLGNGEGGVNCAKMTRSGPARIVAGYGSGALAIWDYNKLEVYQNLLAHDGEVLDLSPSPSNPRLVASCGMDGKVCLFDMEVTKPRGTISIKSDVPTTVAFHEDSVHIAIGTQKGAILYYTWRNTYAPLFEIPDAHVPYPVTSVSFQTPRLSSAPSTPSRAAKQRTQGKSPAQSPARRNKADQAFLRGSHERVSIGSTLSSLSASTGMVGGQWTVPGAAGVVPKIEPVRESHGDEATSLSLSEIMTPPRSPNRVNNTVAASNATRAAAIAANRQRELEQSRAMLAEVSATSALDIMESEDQVRHSTSSTASSNITAVSTTLEALDRLQHAQEQAAAPPASASAPAHAPLTQAMSHREEKSAPEDVAEEKRSLSPSQSSSAPRYSRADVDSLISARMSHRLSQAEKQARESFRGSTEVDSHLHSTQQQTKGKNKSAGAWTGTGKEASNDEKVEALRKGMAAVSSQELQESLAVLKFDIHRDIRAVLTEQTRQFAMYKDDMAEMVSGLSRQLQAVLEANADLRKENERLRHIY